MLTKGPVSLLMSYDDFQKRFPNAEGDWAKINDDIDAAPDDAREITPDRRLLGIGARPSRIEGEAV